MSKAKRNARRFLALSTAAATAISGLALPGTTGAAVYTYTGGDGATNPGLWSDTLNWNPSTAPPTSGDTAIFNNGGNGFTTLSLAGTVQLSTLEFDTASAASYTIGAGSGDALSLDAGGLITLTNTVAQNQTIVAGIALGNDSNSDGFTFNNSSSSLLTVGAITGNAATGNVDTLTLTGAGQIVISGIISDSLAGGHVALVQNSAGTTVLAGSNTYTGNTTVTTGTLTVNGSIAAGSTVAVGTAGTLKGTGSIGGNATLTGAGIINFSAGGNIAGTLGITGGNWNGVGTVTGLATSSSGTFTIGTGANLTATAGLSVTGGTLAAGSATSTLTGNLNYSSGTGSTFAGVIAGAASSVVMNNSGAVLTLSGANTFGGGLNIQAGTVTGTTSAASFGAGTITFGVNASSAASQLNGSAFTYTNAISVATGYTGVATISTNSAAPTFSGAITLNSNNLTFSDNGFNITATGGVTGTGNINLTSAGAGIITLSTGAINNVGTINMNGVNTSANGGTSLISAPVGANVTQINYGQTGSGFTATALTVSGAITVGGSNKVFNSTGTSLFTLSGGVTGTGNLTFNDNSTGGITASGTTLNNVGTITNSGTGAGVTAISSVIGTSVTSVVENSATSFLNLSGANTWTGGLVIKSGTVNSLVSTTALGGGTVTLGDTSGSNAATVLFGTNSLTEANNFVLSSGTTGALTIGITASTVGTVLTGTVTGTNNLIVVNSTNGGTGRPSFTGLVNNAGTITLVGTNAATTAATTFSSIGSNVTKLDIASTGFTPLTVTALAVNSGGTTLANDASGAGTIGVLLVSGGITGTGNLILNDNNSTITNGITLSTTAVNPVGTITNSGTGANTVLISAAIGAGTSGNVTQVIENSATSALTASGGLVVAAAGTTLSNNNASGSSILNLSGAVSGTGNLILNNSSSIGTAISTVGAATGGLTLGAVNNTGTITNSSTGTGPVYITGAIGTAVTAINQNSTTSPLVITGGTAGTTTGTVTIAANTTLQLGNQAANNNALGTGTIVDNGTLIFAPGTTNLTYANIINGNGNVTLNGLAAGAPAGITLSATTGTFTGTYTANQGRLIVTAQTNLGNAADVITINGNSGTLTGGQFWLNGAVSIANPITLNGYGPSEAAGNLGAIRMLTGGTYAGPITLASNASINPQNSGGTISGNITGGAGAQLLIGTPSGNQGGTLTITGTANTYSGGTLIAGATAAANVVGAFGPGAVTLANFTNSGLSESVANALTGTNSLTVTGGTATLSQTNNYTGGTTVNGGTLTLSTANAIGTGPITVSSGTLNVNAVGALGNVNLSQTGGTVAQSTANAFAGGTTLNLSGGTTNLSQANAYTGGANISGSNVTNVSAAGALSGTTNVTGGTLSSSLATGLTQGGNIVASGGVLTSALAGGQFTNVALSGAGVINPGGVGTVGTGALTITNLTTNGGTLQFDTTGPSNTDLISVNGSYSFGAGTNISFFGTLPGPGTYNLIQYSGANPNLGNFVVSAPSGETYTLGESGGFVQLLVAGTYAGVSGNWLPTTAGPFSWSTPANWSGGVVPQTSGDTASFTSTLTAAQTVTVDGLQHVGTLAIGGSGAFATTINQGTAGSTIFLDNGASAAALNNLANNNTIAAPISLVSSNTNVNIASGTTLTFTGTTSGAGKLTVTGGNGTLALSGTGAWTGGTEVDSGTLAITSATLATAVNNAGVGTITLNGGTLSFTNGTSTVVTPAGFTLAIGASGGTFNNAGAGITGKVNVQNPNLLTGSGTLTKTGAADLQDGSASIGFTGNVIDSGLIEDQNVAGLGFGTTTGFTGGSLTVPTGGEVVTSGIQIFNPVTLSGGTLSANSSNNGIFNSTVTLTATSTLRASQFQGQTVAQNFAVNTLAGSANLNVNGSTTASAIGMVTLGNASGYTGAITVGANAALGVGSGSFFGSGATINNFTNVTSGIGLLADGDGTSSPQTLAFTLPSQVTAATFGTGNTTGYIVGKQGATILSNQEANKTLSLSAALPYNNTNTLNVQPFNGYGLLLTAQPALTATTTFGVGTVVSVGGVAPAAQASNVIAGLTLKNLTGTSFGIIKTGAGTLQLGTSAADASNTFGFTAQTAAAISVTGGIVSAFADQNLGAAGNNITLNNTTLAEFLALNSFGTSRIITLGAATGNTIGVAGGSTLTLNSGLNWAATADTFSKVENGTLVLTAPSTIAGVAGTPTGASTINAGAIAITNTNQIGPVTVANNIGDALQISGGNTFTQALSLSNGGIQSAGALEVTSGSPTWNATITAASAANIGVDNAGSTLTVTPALTLGANAIGFTGAGSVIINGGFGASTGAVSMYGTGTLTLNATGTTYGAIAADNGTMVLAGTSTAGAGATNVNYGGTLTVNDNLSTNQANRLVAHTFVTTGGANFNLIGASNATSSDGFLGFNVGRGLTTVTATPTGTGQANLTLTAATGAWTRNTSSTAVFTAGSGVTLATSATAGDGTINTGVITTAANFQGAGTVQTGTANLGILPWATVNNNGTITLATSTVIGPSGFIRNLGAGETVGGFANLVNANAASTSNTLGTTAASTTLTTNNNLASSLFVGESVSGANIPANDFIIAISGSTLTLNVAGTAAASNVLLTFGTTGTNVNLTSATFGPGGTTGQVGTLAQSINSLTLGTGGSLTLANSNQVITLGGTVGGAILAIDSGNNNTIAGGQITAGANELIIHTPSALNISSNITGSGAVTKDGAAALTLSANSFATGQYSINSGPLTLAAGNNTIQYASAMAVDANATLKLNGNSQFFTNLVSDNTTVAPLGFIGSSSAVVDGGTGSSSTLVIRGDGTAHGYAGTIVNNLALLHADTAAVTWTLGQTETYTGPTLLTGGTVALLNTGAFSGTSSLTLLGGNLTLDNNTGTNDSATRLAASLPISMGNSTLSYIGRAQFTSAESLGAITGTIGTNSISITQQTTGVSSATLTLASLTRQAGSTINFANTNGTLGTIGSNPQILITAAPALSNNLIGGGYTVNGTDFASYNATYGVGALGTTGFAGYSPFLINNAGPNDNVSMAVSTGIAINTETVNSLRITGTTAINQNPGTTLTLASGGLLATNNLTFGSAVNQGNLTTTGSELFLLGGGTSTINSAIIGSGVALVRSGGTYTLAGTNTYSGGTYLDAGTLTLANAGNVATGLSTLGTGGIFVSSGTLTQTAGGVIPAQALTIEGDATGGASTVTLNSQLAVTGSVTTANSNVVSVPSTNGIVVGQLVTGTGLPGSEFVTAVNPTNNTVTITSGSGVTAGTNTLTFLVNNTLNNLTFNNTGGTSAPTLTVGGLLNLPNGVVTASSNNPATTSLVTGGTLDFGNVASPTITVNPITFNGQNIAPLQATLAIASVIQNSNNAISVTGGGNLQLSGASTFSGGVNLAGGTNLTVTGSSANAASGQPLTGPLGTGTLTIGTGSTLYADAAGRSVGNNVVVSGNFGFDATTATAASLTLGAGSQTIALPAGVATTITVNAPQMTGILNDTVTGAGSTIVKAGLGTLQLNNNIGGSSSFSGGVVVNSGTLLATGVGATGTSLGSGPVILSGGVLQLHHNGQGNNGIITYGNNVDINSALANAFIDVNDNGTNTGNTIVMGILDYGTVSGTTFTSTVSGNPAPGTILNVTGGNGYKLQFNGTTLTNATSSPTFDVGSGLTLILPGGFTVGGNLPTNIGPGTLSYSGNNTGAVAVSPITGSAFVSPATGGSSTPLGTGGITLNNGSSLNFTPILGTMSATGYAGSGAVVKYYDTGLAAMTNAGNFGIAPNSTLTGGPLSDGHLGQSPFGVNNAGYASNTLVTYQALLNINNAGTYYFGSGADDQMELLIDGQLVVTEVGAGTAVTQNALQSVQLSAGAHQIIVREFNEGSGGGSYVLYGGPDTGANGITGTPPVNNLQSIPLNALSYATNYTGGAGGNNFQNAAILGNAITIAAGGTATIDGQGTDFNYGIPSLTLAAGSTLIAQNGAGTSVGTMGNGVFVVTGLTDASAGTGTVNQTTGTLVLAGGVYDNSQGLTKTGPGNVILGNNNVLVTGLTTTSGLTVGETVTGANIPAGTTIASIVNGTSLFLTAGVTAANLGSQTLSFGGGAGVSGTLAPAFTGAFNISGGFVQLQDPAGLTTGTTTIGTATTPATLDLNGQTVTTIGNILINGGAGPAGKTSNTPAGLYNSSAATASLPAGGTLSVGVIDAAANASIGGFGNINVLGTIQDGGTAAQPLNKVGPDTLILSNTNTFTGQFNIVGGTVQLTGANGFTSSTTSGVVETAGTTVDLNGQTVTTTQALTLSGAGVTGVGTANQLGALVNSSGSSASYAGPITLATASNIGGPSLIAGVDGGITLSGAITGANSIVKIGANNLTLTATAGAETFIDVQSGSVTLSGAGAEASVSNANLVRQGTTFTLDNSATAVSNRLGNRETWLSGNFVVNGNSGTAVTETISQGGNNFNVSGTFANGFGGASITLNAAGTAGVQVQVASSSNAIFTRGAGGTLLIRGDNLGSATVATPVANTAQFLGNGTSLGLSANNGAVGQTGQWNAPNALIYQWAVADTSANGVGIGFAGYNTFGGAGAGANFGTANTGGVAPINIDANNSLANAPTVTAINANIVQNSATVTVGSTAGLAVGQLVVGTNIPANDVITAINSGTTFTLAAIVPNTAGFTSNQTLEIYANPTTTVSSGITNAATTVTVASTANLYVGEVVSGTGITSGTTIASIQSTTGYTLSAAATATNAAASLVYGLAGYANIAASTSQAVGSATAAREQNSITLTSGAGLTITSGLQLDSGGVLAVGNADNATVTNYTIGGTGMLTGTNALNREMVFHVTGAANTLTVNAPIFVNGGGLTKADGGTLVLGSPETYTGVTTLNGGITRLAGGANTIFTPFTVAPSAGNTAAAVSGQNFFVDNGATLDLNGNNQAVSNLLSGSGTQLSGGTVINSSGSATLHIAPNANQTFAGNLSNAGAGTLNLVRDGNSTTTFNSPNTLGGTVTLTGGATTLVDLGTFQNASAINVTRSALIWNDQGVQAVGNRLSATAPITLTGGGLQFLTRAGTGSTPTATISLGTVNLGVGESNIVVSSVGQGAQASLTFAGLGTRAVGSALSFGNGTFAAGSNPDYYFTSAPTLTNGIIGAWATVNSLITSSGGANIGFATYDPVSGVRALQYQPNATYGAGVNTMISASTTIPAPQNIATTTTVNSLSLYNSTTLSFTNAFDTLVVQSGGIISGTDFNNKVIGSTATPGRIVSGAGNDLYIHAGVNTTANDSDTLTINSKIIDNGSNNNVVIDAASTAGTNTPTVTLTNANTYGGSTYLSGATLTLNSLLGPAIPHDIILSGGNNASADSLIFNQTSLNFSLPNQLASTANVTMNGATQINLGSGTNSLVANSQTINSLTINNDGGSNGGNGPTIFTQAGTLTVNGTINSTNNTETFTIPTINGFLNLATGNINVDANQYVGNQIGLAINANIVAPSITKSGTGFLGIGSQNANFTGAVNVNNGGLALSATGAILGGQVILGSGTTLDTRGLSGTIGSLASGAANAVVMNGLQGTAGTIITGLDNSSSSFAGTLQSPYPTGLLNVTKIGGGIWTLTNNSSVTNNGTFTDSSGGVTVNGSNGQISFSTYTLNTGGTLTADNSASPLNNRLGGATLTTTAAVLAPTYRVINIQGGNLTVNGNSSAVSEALGNIASLDGGGIITLNASGTGGVNVTIGQIASQSDVTSLLIRGDNLGSATGVNNATVLFNTAGAAGTTPGLALLGSGGANGTTTKSIRPDIIVDPSASGTGTSFLTVDTTTGLIRPLNAATELAGTLTNATAAGTNIGLSSVASGMGSATVTTAAYTLGSVTLNSGGGVNENIIQGNAWSATGALLNLNVQSTGGVLALSGNTGIAAGEIQSSSNVTEDFQVPVLTNTLALNAPINSQNGWVKAGAGTLQMNQPYFTNGQGTNVVTINGGTVKFGPGLGANPIFVLTQATTPAGTSLQVNNGTLDLNGNNQLIGTLTTTNPLPFAGGTAASPNSVITNSNAVFATFTTNNTSSVVSAEFTGNLNLDKAGTGTMTLSSPQTYLGTTTIRGGVVSLRDSGSIGGPGAINLNYGALQLDNTGLTDSTSRIPAAAQVNFTGGALKVLESQRIESMNLGTLALTSGDNDLNLTNYNSSNNTSSYTINIANLTQTNSATLNIVSTVNGALGNFSGANNHIFLSQVNGAAFNASSMVDGIIAPWLTVNQNDWATYSNVAGVTTPNSNGTANYGALGGGATANASVTATAVNNAGQTINSLAVRTPGAATTIGLNGTADVLTIASGGVILNTGVAVNIQGGSITAGPVNSPSTLYLNSFAAGTTTFNSPIVNNGTGALSVVRSGGGIVTLTPEVVEAVPTLATAQPTITVPSAAGLSVGMAITGTNIAGGTTITGIAGNVITLSASTTAGTAGTNQTTFAPAQSTASGTTTAGTNSVTILAANLPSGFTPAIGMTIGSSVNIAGGTTITAVTLGTTDTITLSQNATASSGAATLIFNPLNNSFTGTTISSSGTLDNTGGTLNLTGLPGSITVPGNLTVNNSTVTEVTNQGQIAAASNVTINGGGILNLVGTNTLNSVTFNNNGGGVTPAVNVGTLLNLTSATPVTEPADNTAFTSTIAGTGVNFSNASGVTITTSGASADSLIISAPITTNALGTTTNTNATITKAGTGSLVLPNANAASLTWTLNGGTLILGNATALGANNGTVTVTGSGGIEAATAALTIANPITFNAGGNLALGGTSTVNQITLSGGVNLNGAAPIITVAATPTTDTITGQITGAGGFTKAGAGALTLTPATASTFTGPVTVSGGLLTMGNASALGGAGNNAADLTVSTGAALNLNAFALSVGSLAGGGLLTNSGAVQTLTTGAGADVNNTTFSGVLTAATTANLALTKTGTNTQALTGLNTYAGITTISAGTLAANTLTVEAATNGTTTSGSTTVTGLAGAGTAGIVVGQAVFGTGIPIGAVVSTIVTSTSFTISLPATAGGTSALTFSGSSLGNSSNAATNLVISGATLQYTGAAGTTDRSFTAGTAGATLDGSGTGPINFNNATPVAFLGTNTARTLTLTGTNTGNNTLAAVIGNNGTGATTLNKTGIGAWVISGANTYLGPTAISQGTLRTGATNTLPNLTVVTVGQATTNNAATLDLMGFSQQVAGILSAGTSLPTDLITNNAAAGTATLTVNNDAATSNADFTYGGIITDGASAQLALVKTGTRSLSLTGNNAYSGGTTIGLASGTAGGTLVINTATSMGLPAGSATINNGTLEVNTGGPGSITSTRNFALGNAASTIQTDANQTFNVNGLITNAAAAGTLNKTGTGTLALGNAGSFTGGTNINSGTVLANFADATHGSLGTGTVAINAGGLLGGGSVGAATSNLHVVGPINVNSGGTISAGTSSVLSAGQPDASANLVTASQTWNNGGTYAWKLNTNNAGTGTPNDGSTPFAPNLDKTGAGWDQLTTNSLSIANGATFNIQLISFLGSGSNTFNPTENYQWIAANVPTGGVFTAPAFTLAVAPNPNGYYSAAWQPASSLGDTGVEDLVITYSPAPEPTSLMLLGLGAGGLLLRRRRRRTV